MFSAAALHDIITHLHPSVSGNHGRTTRRDGRCFRRRSALSMDTPVIIFIGFVQTLAKKQKKTSRSARRSSPRILVPADAAAPQTATLNFLPLRAGSVGCWAVAITGRRTIPSPMARNRNSRGWTAAKGRLLSHPPRQGGESKASRFGQRGSCPSSMCFVFPAIP